MTAGLTCQVAGFDEGNLNLSRALIVNGSLTDDLWLGRVFREGFGSGGAASLVSRGEGRDGQGEHDRRANRELT